MVIYSDVYDACRLISAMKMENLGVTSACTICTSDPKITWSRQLVIRTT